MEQVIKVHASGNAAWFSLVFDETCVAQGEPVSVEGVRGTGVLEKMNNNWVIVQAHFSVALVEAEVEN